MPGAQLAWTKPYEGTEFHAAVYAKQWNNPRPDVEIRSLDVLPGDSSRGTAALLAVTGFPTGPEPGGVGWWGGRVLWIGVLAMILAGGQSLLPLLNLRLARPSVLVDVSRIAELDYVVEKDGALEIGAQRAIAMVGVSLQCQHGEDGKHLFDLFGQFR